MPIRTTLSALALVLILSGAANATILRTAPFPGGIVTAGTARCGVTNGSDIAGNASTTLYTDGGTAIFSDSFPSPLLDKETRFGTSVELSAKSASYCECVVPSTRWRCSFIHIDGSNIVVIEGR